MSHSDEYSCYQVLQLTSCIFKVEFRAALMYLGAIFPQILENPRVNDQDSQRVITRLGHIVHGDKDNENGGAYRGFYAGGPIPILWRILGNYPGEVFAKSH